MNFHQFVVVLRKSIRFIDERIVLRNILLAGIILLMGIWIILTGLKIYTRHNHDLTVPDFTGLTFTEASEIGHSKDLVVELFDSVFLADFERGTVVEQHPKAGFKVKKNRKIFLTMNAINPEKVVMPNLVDLTFRQARAKLESFGLKVGQIIYEPDLAINIVLAQRIHGNEILPGDTITKGAEIDLVLGKGLSDEQTAIPNLVGLSLENAKILASDRFLSIGAAVHDQTITTEQDEMNALVFRQKPEPAPDVTLPLGSSIDVWITLDSTKLPSHAAGVDTLSNEE
jgi:beta-lactam-binding protein with PASTA domain